MRQKIKSILSLLLIIIFFIIFSYLIQSNLNFFENLIGRNIFGILIYILIICLAIVVAPVSSIPLIPIMSNIWGWKITGVVSVFGWTLGSVMVFLLVRKYGVKLVNRVISLEQIYKIENKIPEKNLFLSALLLRIIIPVDVLSYALSLFSKIKFWPYTISTFFGVLPVTFLLSYLGTIPFIYQILILLVFLIIILIIYIVKMFLKLVSPK